MIEQPYAEMLACFQLLRCLGVAAEDIYAYGTPDMALMQVRQAGKTFSIQCGVLENVPNEVFAAKWTEAAQWWTSTEKAQDTEREKLWRGSNAYQYRFQVWEALLRKGFSVRGTPEWEIK